MIRASNDIFALMRLIKETNRLYSLTHTQKAHFNIVWGENKDFCKITCRKAGQRFDVNGWQGNVKRVYQIVHEANERTRAELEAMKTA